jgi:hypothetical protein
MPAPDSVTVEIINSITSVEVSPVEEINQIGVSTVPEVTQVAIDNTEGVSTITFAENAAPLVVSLSQMDFTAPVTSVNGQTGDVVLTFDYPDIQPSDPVNHVKYVHTQASISNSWTINHNLNFFPNVTVLDNANRILETYIQYNNLNSVTIIMNSPASGKAFLT